MGICIIHGCDLKARARKLCVKHYARLMLTGTTDPGPKAHASFSERFWRYVEKRADDECWPWDGHKTPNGYGRIQTGGKGSPHESAHRVSYELHHGPIPEGLVIMHSCDNPACVNPAHLSVGTYKDNTQDMIRKGRKRGTSPIGERSGKARLTEEAVRFIRANPTMTHVALARHLGVGTSTIRGVRIGRVWSHVT